jgi:large conductance mechanosensitive channel
MGKTKGFIGEFRAFITRGNVLDMAVGVIVATAFGKITTSLVNDVFMPFIGWIFGGMDLSKLNIILKSAVMDGETVVSPAVVIGIGTFLSAIIDFLIVAFLVFLVVKAFNKMREAAEAKKKAAEAQEAAADAPAEPKPTAEELLAEILAELKNKQSRG